jgi:hypothetical protein
MAERRLVRPAVEAQVRALRADGNLDLRGEALAQVALRLAGLLDGGKPPTMTAAWAKELRATLAELVPKEAADGDPDAAWVNDLGGCVTPIRNAAGPRSGDARA